MTQILEVVSVSEAQQISRRDGTPAVKQTLLLRNPGGEYEDAYLCIHMGDKAVAVEPGKLVAANLRFQVREAIISGVSTDDGKPQVRQYQDIYLKSLRIIASIAATPATSSWPSYATLPGVPITEAAPF